MIKVFNKENLNSVEVVRLWQDSFGDSEEYIKFFLENCPDYVCVEYIKDNITVSMLFLLNGYVNSQKCKYLYAACTHKDYRRQGIMEKLIDYSKEYCFENGYSAIFLVPATEKLYNYYAKLGFISSFRKNEICIKTNNVYGSRENNSSVDINEIFLLKSKLLNKVEGFKFDSETIIYTIQEHLFNGGEIFLLNDNEETTLAFYNYDGADVVIKELLSDTNDIISVVNEHFFNKDTENIYIYTPIVYNTRDKMENYTKCGMCLPLNEKMFKFLKDKTDLYAGMYLD